MNVQGYPVLFDTDFNSTRSDQYLALLKKANYIDAYTEKLTVTLPLFNFMHAKLALVTVKFTPQKRRVGAIT